MSVWSIVIFTALILPSTIWIGAVFAHSPELEVQDDSEFETIQQRCAAHWDLKSHSAAIGHSLTIHSEIDRKSNQSAIQQ